MASPRTPHGAMPIPADGLSREDLELLGSQAERSNCGSGRLGQYARRDIACAEVANSDLGKVGLILLERF